MRRKIFRVNNSAIYICKNFKFIRTACIIPVRRNTIRNNTFPLLASTKGSIFYGLKLVLLSSDRVKSRPERQENLIFDAEGDNAGHLKPSKLILYAEKLAVFSSFRLWFSCYIYIFGSEAGREDSCSVF